MAGLSDKAMIAKLTIGMISFTEKDKKMTSRVHDEILHNHKNVGKWLKEKMSRDDVRPILRLIDDARNYYRSVSRPFGDDGGRLIPIARIEEFCKKMGEMEREFGGLKKNMVDNWDYIVQMQKDRLQGDFNPKSYPTLDKLERIVRFEWKVSAVPEWSFLHDQDHPIFQIEEEVRKEILEKAREEERVRLNESVAYLWTRLADAVERMAQACSDKSSKVYEATIKALEQEKTIIRELNFTNDYEIETICDEIENKLTGWNAKQIRRNLDLKLRLGRSASVIMERIKGRITLGVLQAA